MIGIIVTLIVCALCGYLLGSINTSLVVGMFYRVDVRKYGSGNAGTTNVLRVLGKKAAAMTFAGDFLKGILACFVGWVIVYFFTDAFYGMFRDLVSDGVSNGFISDILELLSSRDKDYIVENARNGGAVSLLSAGYMTAGFFSVIGHNWPVYFKFKGGKGVLTTFAVMIAIAPIPALFSLLFFIIVVAISRYISLGSILAAVFLPTFLYISYILKLNLLKEDIKLYLIFCIPLAFLVIIRHNKNIKRLINRTENKLSFKKVKGGVE